MGLGGRRLTSRRLHDGSRPGGEKSRVTSVSREGGSRVAS